MILSDTIVASSLEFLQHRNINMPLMHSCFDWFKSQVLKSSMLLLQELSQIHMKCYTFTGQSRCSHRNLFLLRNRMLDLNLEIHVHFRVIGRHERYPRSTFEQVGELFEDESVGMGGVRFD